MNDFYNLLKRLLSVVNNLFELEIVAERLSMRR